MMVFKISYAPCPSRGLRAFLSDNTFEYGEKITAILEEGVRLDKVRSEQPVTDVKTDRQIDLFVMAICWLAYDISSSDFLTHQSSKWANYHCASEWYDCLSSMWAAPAGQPPVPGQSGSFDIALCGGYKCRVLYQPQFGISDHFQFFHLKNGVRVKDPMPLSETGYKSWFTYRPIVLEEGGVLATALAFASDSSNIADVSSLNQLALF
ncbi:hypothetical protein O4H49_20460 [Kiloniella laminariae]|uniref:Uncharacterized protein n=1 Tax=Kiloniella laminariae TaxID=454162 RepID=A0ABT4LPU6_9PROT|nr:hypothetical protein [Kiloniella laminariae]MCZ4283162.1 hypothetical protein [Kiloniella laminariae]